MMKFEYETMVVSNYTTDDLHRALNKMGDRGYELVTVEMAKNNYGIMCMYLFFKRDKKEND